ncbi:hypothetical protein N7447_010528 [Penicillium robsamsonii]|uniref:uncharacterized protein n=1 Tax=Penicillium robsamsonii TaxID=1792511 RepID=UPI00254977C1|nr:uncharacterized protein N7447_010528 [Penicillium robsamsonii]KAJ5811012.1 hypothetical protein N7447_010528 [Penicillium robsamsonii]
MQNSVLLQQLTLPESPTTKTVPPSSTTTTISASVCSSLTSNPSYTPSAVLPDDYTWGCAPGYLCKPPHTGDRSGCNVEAGLPEPGYVCNPSDCIVAPPLDVHPSWQYNVSNNYYNLNPEDFGLDYSIFHLSEDPSAANSKRYMSLWDFDVAQNTKRADITNIPDVCYNDCNGAALVPEKLGKTSELCKSDSPFMENLGVCEECITNNGESGSDAYSSKMLPTFVQWLNYCSDMVTSTTQESTTSTKTKTPTTTTRVTDRTTTTSTEATTAATVTGTQATRTKVPSTEETTAEPTNTVSKSTQSTDKSTTGTEREETTGSVVTTSFSGHVVTISTSGSLVTSSVPRSIITTSVSGSLITTSLPGSIKTTSSTLDAGSGDESTSDNASGSTSGAGRGSQTDSTTTSAPSPSYNAARSINIPRVGLMGLLWAAFAPLL